MPNDRLLARIARHIHWPIVGTAFVLIGLLAGNDAEGGGTAFYCGSRIIDIGMTEDFVLQHCGSPDSQSTEQREVRGSSNRVLGTTTIDRWTWRRGYNGTRVLVFFDGKLQSIQQF